MCLLLVLRVPFDYKDLSLDLDLHQTDLTLDLVIRPKTQTISDVS